jgi:hypothetical protein
MNRLFGIAAGLIEVPNPPVDIPGLLTTPGLFELPEPLLEVLSPFPEGTETTIVCPDPDDPAPPPIDPPEGPPLLLPVVVLEELPPVEGSLFAVGLSGAIGSVGLSVTIGSPTFELLIESLPKSSGMHTPHDISSSETLSIK